MPSSLELLNKNILQYIDYLKSQKNIISDTKAHEMIVKFRAEFLVIMNTSPETVLTYFLQLVYPHKEEIDNKDEGYFLGLNYGEDQGGNDVSMMSALHIKELWKNNFTEENKKSSFTYFQVFNRLVERCVKEKLDRRG